jgi:hypothetical protein
MYSLQPYRPSGTLLNMRSMPKRSPATYIAGGLVIAMWLAAFFFGFPRLQGFTFVLLIVGLVVATIAVPAGVIYSWQALVNTRLGEPLFRVNTSQIRRGTELQCEFVQPVKGRVAINDARIQLVLHEWVKYTEGTNTYTKTHTEVVDEMVFDGQQKNTGEEIWLQANFRIPSHATHNFSYSNNRLQWLLIVTVSIPSWPDYYEEYALEFPADAQ